MNQEKSQQDLRDLGFKCGVEIHQQLLTSKKLFCRCPSGVYSKQHDAEILRHMRPTLSEMGTYDGCAMMEFKTKKEILYLLHKDSVCTYEMDDTPPFPINQEALDIAIEIALLFNCQIVDEVHVARKQYLDGSIPTGFQRTAIIGINGYVDIGEKRIGVRQLSIEEDSCREVDDKGHRITFRTDRLGMPLIEVVTEPDFETPEQAALGVKIIGRLLRATQKVRRGIGHVRQDVNVSISGGSRVEIKGVPRYQDIPALTRTEALRQKALLDLVSRFKKMGIAENNIDFYDKDITYSIKNTRSLVLKEVLSKGGFVRGIKISKIAGLLDWKTEAGESFSSEIAGRVRVIACLDDIPNIYHTDHYPDYNGSHIDLRRIKNLFNTTDEDVVIIVWGNKADTITACEEIKNRVIEAIKGVPEETRQHRRGGLTCFERILPGVDRMYPDTDHPPLAIEAKRVDRIRKFLPELVLDVEKRFSSNGIPAGCVEYLALSHYKELVDDLILKGVNGKIIGFLFGQTVKNLEQKGVNLKKISRETWLELVDACVSNNVKQKDFKCIIKGLAEDTGWNISDICKKYNWEARGNVDKMAVCAKKV